VFYVSFLTRHLFFVFKKKKLLKEKFSKHKQTNTHRGEDLIIIIFCFLKKVGIYIKKISRPETERKKVKSKKEPKKLTVW